MFSVASIMRGRPVDFVPTDSSNYDLPLYAEATVSSIPDFSDEIDSFYTNYEVYSTYAPSRTPGPIMSFPNYSEMEK